jgi:adiponectin receptor
VSGHRATYSSRPFHIPSDIAPANYGAVPLTSGLIAASFGTVVYDGFYCQPKTVVFYCSLNALCGALGSYLPFQRWFNERKHKVRTHTAFTCHLNPQIAEWSYRLCSNADIQNWRIAFFLFLNFTMVAPLFQMCYQHGYSKALAFGGE